MKVFVYCIWIPNGGSAQWAVVSGVPRVRRLMWLERAVHDHVGGSRERLTNLFGRLPYLALRFEKFLNLGIYPIEHKHCSNFINRLAMG